MKCLKGVDSIMIVPWKRQQPLPSLPLKTIPSVPWLAKCVHRDYRVRPGVQPSHVWRTRIHHERLCHLSPSLCKRLL